VGVELLVVGVHGGTLSDTRQGPPLHQPPGEPEIHQHGRHREQCDEVTSALDPGTAAAVMDLLTTLRAERGLGLVVISHDRRLVAAYTDTVVVLEEGRVIRTGPTRALLPAPQ
jgi:ABC-type hemin transport system ATPase subunit